MVRPTVLVLAVALAVVPGSAAHVAADEPADGAPVVPASSPAPAGCEDAPPPAPRPVAAAGPGRTVVTFTVPARTVVQLDAAGDPARVSTNTGCPPRPDDLLLVVDGTGDPVARGVDVGAVAWTGDWSQPGGWHPWPAR